MNYLIGQVFNLKLSESGNGFYSRTIAGVVPVKPKGRVLTGLVSVFGNVDADGDIVAPGAFQRSIAEWNAGRSRCRFLWNHDRQAPPIATILDLKEVQRTEMPSAFRSAPNINGALEVTAKYHTDDFSERVFQGVISGAIQEMSFAYNTVKSHLERAGANQINVLDELELLDCSPVNYGANPLTMAAIKGPEVVKGRHIPHLEKLKQINARRQRLQSEIDFLENPKSFVMGDWDRFVASVGKGGKVGRTEMSDLALKAQGLEALSVFEGFGRI